MSPWRAAYSAAVGLALPYALWRARRRSTVPPQEYLGRIPIIDPPSRPVAEKTEQPSAAAPTDGPTVWLHAVSVGEAAAAEAFVRALRRRRPDCRWIVTHTTAAGREKLRALFGDFARVAACPLDWPGCVRTFMQRIRPALAVVMEAEYWPNLLAAADESGAKILLANARLGRKNARRYATMNPLMRETVGRLSVAAAQTRADLRRLQFFGLKRGVVAGNLKFDRVPDANQIALGNNRRARLAAMDPAKPVVLFASVRDGEGEALIAAADDEFLRSHFCIFAPRHPERCEGIVAALTARGIAFSRDTRDGEIGAPTETETAAKGGVGVGRVGVGRVGVGVHVADSLGRMAAHYAMCDAALVGGGLAGGFGGQNPIEAMAQGVAAVCGPDVANYAELTAAAARAGALLRARDAGDAIRLLRELCAAPERRRLQGERARGFCKARRGAAAAVLQLAEELLPPKKNLAPVGR